MSPIMNKYEAKERFSGVLWHFTHWLSGFVLFLVAEYCITSADNSMLASVPGDGQW